MQSFFASEMKVVDDLTVWRDFSSHCRRVLALFEAHDFSEEELQQAHGVHSSGESKNGAAGGGGAGGGETGVGYSGSKYLTSSQVRSHFLLSFSCHVFFRMHIVVCGLSNRSFSRTAILSRRIY